MGKASATYTAIKTALTTAHRTEFESIVMTLRTPFEAAEAGDLCRQGMALLIGPTADNPLAYGGAARRVITGFTLSVFIVAMLGGRTGTKTEEQVMTDLLDAAEDVSTTLEGMTGAPATTFVGLQINSSTTLYDADGNYAAIEIQLTTSILRT